MKIALCLSGQPRNLNYGFDFWKKNLLDRYDIDVFVHTWWDQKRDINSHFCKKNEQSGDLSTKASEDTINKIYELYNPKKCIIEHSYIKNFSENDFNNINNKNVLYGRHSMFYSIFKANELKSEYEKQNKMIYDIVIRGRFDYGFEPINLEEYSLEFLHVRYHRTHTKFSIADCFFFSNSKIMNKVCEIYFHLATVNKKFLAGKKILCHPETLFGAYILLQENIPIKEHVFSDFLIRGKKNEKWYM